MLTRIRITTVDPKYVWSDAVPENCFVTVWPKARHANAGSATARPT